MLILSVLIVETPSMAKADGSIEAQDIWLSADETHYPPYYTSTNDGSGSIEDNLMGPFVNTSSTWENEAWDISVIEVSARIYKDTSDPTPSKVAIYEYIAVDNAGELYGLSDEKSLAIIGTNWFTFDYGTPAQIGTSNYVIYVLINADTGTGENKLVYYSHGSASYIARSTSYPTYPNPLTGESGYYNQEFHVSAKVKGVNTNQTTYNQFYGTSENYLARRDIDITFPSGVGSRQINMTHPKTEGLLNITYSNGGLWDSYLSSGEYTNSEYNLTHNLISIPESSISAYGEDFRVFTETNEYTYTLHGLFYENGTFKGDVDVTAVTSSGPVEYNVNGTLIISGDTEVMFFYWSLSGGGSRRIYTTQSTEEFWIFTPNDTYSSYSFDITDYIGAIGFQDSYLELYSLVNSTTHLVERYLIWDSESESPLTAMLNKIYSLKIRLPSDSLYSFGYWVPTTATPPTLTLSMLHPDDYYQPISGIVEIQATRPNATHIQIEYFDKMDLTLSVFVNITLRNETMVYNVTGGSPIEIFNWYDAVNSTEYVVNVNASHSYYGPVTYSTTLIGETDYEPPPSWSIIGIEDQWVYIGLIIVVAGTVSMANAAVGLFAGSCVAAAFVYLNLVEIPYELLAGAFIISILMGLTKR